MHVVSQTSFTIFWCEWFVSIDHFLCYVSFEYLSYGGHILNGEKAEKPELVPQILSKAVLIHEQVKNYEKLRAMYQEMTEAMNEVIKYKDRITRSFPLSIFN